MYLHEYAISTRTAKLTDMSLLVLVNVANVFFLVNVRFAKYVDHVRSRRLAGQIDLSNIFLVRYVHAQFSVSRFVDSHRPPCHSSHTGRSRRQIPVDNWNIEQTVSIATTRKRTTQFKDSAYMLQAHINKY